MTRNEFEENRICFPYNPHDTVRFFIVEDLNGTILSSYYCASKHKTQGEILNEFRARQHISKLSLIINNQICSGYNMSEREIRACASGKSPEYFYVCSEDMARKIHSILAQKKVTR